MSRATIKSVGEVKPKVEAIGTVLKCDAELSYFWIYVLKNDIVRA